MHEELAVLPSSLFAPAVGCLCVSLRTLTCAVGGRGEGAWGAAGAVCIWRKGGRVRSDGHFAARTAAALPAPPERDECWRPFFFVRMPIVHKIERKRGLIAVFALAIHKLAEFCGWPYFSLFLSQHSFNVLSLTRNDCI